MRLRLVMFFFCGLIFGRGGLSEADEPLNLLKNASADLKGWSRVPIPVNGQIKNPSPWKYNATTGILTCEGKGHHEWLRFDAEEFGNARIHLEWRFVPLEGGKGYNSGIMFRNSKDGTVWHQVQTGDKSGGSLFGVTEGAKDRFNATGKVPNGNVKPAGEWNVQDISCDGNSISLRTNGEDTVTWDSCKQPHGYFGLEAEGYTIEFRNISVEKLK